MTHFQVNTSAWNVHNFYAGVLHGKFNKQLLDEVEHDIMNYCYLPKPKAEVDIKHRHKGLIIHDIMRKPNSIIIVLLYIFHIIHPQKQKRSVLPFCF